jgi:type III secretion protein V
MSLKNAPSAWLSAVTGNRPLGGSYSDLVLAFGVVAIIAMMILPLPLFVVDVLVAVNIIVAISMVLLAIYVPSPLSFSSFPSVILLSTLFRLSLSIAITRLILLDADAGDIIETFGNMVVGGNIVVGIVVFLIITVVQFIVIAKGAERVAEVAARFSLDAMPGKQLSIDSDLRSGLIEKDEAKTKRRRLEQESQLHGALDGAMKFVKGDAIAGIVILLVNILGGLIIGVIQRGLPFGEAMATYSVLTIGDGLVAQIPALLTAIAAGLLITRTAGEGKNTHLGAEIGQQFFAFPRVLVIGGILSLLLTFVPGFPWLVFLLMGLALLGFSVIRQPSDFMVSKLSLLRRFQVPDRSLSEISQPAEMLPPPAVILWTHPDLISGMGESALMGVVVNAVNDIRQQYGAPVPGPVLKPDEKLALGGYALEAHGIRIGHGVLTDPRASSESQQACTSDISGSWQIDTLNADDHAASQTAPLGLMQNRLKDMLLRQLPLFLGIQETATLVNRWSLDYPDLIKEMLRAVPPQRLAEVLRRLLKEMVSIRNLRDIFEAIADAASREKDAGLITEQVRFAIRRQLGDQYSGQNRLLFAVLVHPELEDLIHQALRSSSAQSPVMLSPRQYQKVVQNLHEVLDRAAEQKLATSEPVLLCSPEVRRHLRSLLEDEFFLLPVLSYQELTGDLRIQQIGQINS